ncbi:hypothetical protein HMPREF2660_06045 [Weeksella sp. HMSC059D05]|nr:hypothetical protein HMPREF2660_06045 [Weeksella sp. HMSC059D05]
MIEKKANENLVKDALNSLSFKQQKNFGFFCMDRIQKLYEDVDSRIKIQDMSEDLENGKAFVLFRFIYDRLKKEDAITLKDLENLRRKSNSLILDTDNVFDSTTENILAKIVSECLYTFLSFLINHKVDDVFDCARLIIDIINAQISDYFFTNIDEDDEKCESFLRSLFEIEYRIQLSAIKFITEENESQLNSLITKTTISKDAIKTIENLRKFS